MKWRQGCLLMIVMRICTINNAYQKGRSTGENGNACSATLTLASEQRLQGRLECKLGDPRSSDTTLICTGMLRP